MRWILQTTNKSLFQNKSREQFVQSSYSIPPTVQFFVFCSILNFKPALVNTLLYCIQAENPILTVTYLNKQICDIQQRQQYHYWSVNLTAASLIHVFYFVFLFRYFYVQYLIYFDMADFLTICAWVDLWYSINSLWMFMQLSFRKIL